MSAIGNLEGSPTTGERSMSWPIWLWERIAGITLVNRWVGRNVISALVSFTVLVFILALALILRDWGLGQHHRFILAIVAFVLMGLSAVAGIGLSIVPGDPLNLGRVFGTHQDPRTRREIRADSSMSIAPNLPHPPLATVKQRWIYMVTYTLQPWLLRDTTAIDRELQRLPNWSHWINNTWLISTDEVADVIYARIRGNFLDTDRLLIARIDPQSGYTGWLPQEAWGWIEENK